jgi:hypothetical protein
MSKKEIPLDECIFGIYDYIFIGGTIAFMIFSALYIRQKEHHVIFPFILGLIGGLWIGWVSASALCVKIYIRRMKFNGEWKCPT